MVAVINFGGQYAHLIARRIRELHVKSELVSPDVKIEDLKKLNPKAIILSGSPHSVYEKNSPKPDPKIYDLQIPILGICYGLQLIAYQRGSKVSSRKKKQFGKIQIDIKKSELFDKLKSPQTVWFSHGDAIDQLPSEFKQIAQTPNVPFAGFENTKEKIYCIQFHPEVTHTINGTTILRNFLFKISKIKPDWNLKDVTNLIIKDLKKELTGKKVLMAISGGVDSLVAAT